MQPPSQPLPFVVAAATLASTVAAQMTSSQVSPNDAQGQMHGWAVGIQIEDPVNVNTPHELLVWGGGTSMTAPESWTAARFGAANQDHPDFSHAALSAWSTSRIGVPAVFRSMSTGGDIVPAVDPTGQLQMLGAWYALSFTVADDSIGVPQSLVRERSLAGNHAADVFTYYVEQSVGFHPELNDSVYLEYDRTQLGLNPWPIGPIETPEINALDWGMGAISIDPNRRGGRFFPIRNRFYFTLSKEWADVFGPALQSATTPLNLTLDPGAIYCLTWEAIGSGFGWSDPVEVFSSETLFPGATGAVEIDAISVFEGLQQSTLNPPSTPLRVVLSLTPASDAWHPQQGAYSQVLVYQHLTTPGVQPLKTQAGALMTDKMGLAPRVGNGEPDDVTGTCGVDPDEIMLACGVGARSIYPLAGIPDPVGNLGLSGYRSLIYDDVGQLTDRFFLTATGTNIGAYPFGAVAFYLDVPGASPYLLDAKLVLPGQLTCTFELPGDLPNISGDLHFRAVLVGPQGSSSDATTPLRESWNVTLKY